MNTKYNSARAWAAAALIAMAITLTAADTDTMGKIDMISVNKMQVVETENAYLLEVDITFQNKNADAVKLRSGSFRGTIETKQQKQDVKIDIGDTTIDELEIPGASNRKSAGTAVKGVSIMLGPKDHESTAKMVRLWNVLGDPSAPMILVLKGTAEVGVKLPKGWVFEQGKSYELELRFVPAVQRRVLFM